jgi:hypothetical protein
MPLKVLVDNDDNVLLAIVAHVKYRSSPGTSMQAKFPTLELLTYDC